MTSISPEVYVARLSMEKGDTVAAPSEHVRADILSSWSRCKNHNRDSKQRDVHDFQERPGRAQLIDAAQAVLSSFFESDPDCRSSVVVVDCNSRLRLRRDGDESLEYVLNSAGMTLGSDAHELRLGTNAGHLSLLMECAVAVVGAEHWKVELSTIAEAASPIRGIDGSVSGAIVVINHVSEHSPMAVSVSKFLAQQVQSLIVDADRRRIGALAEFFASKTHAEDRIVLATDGTHLFTNMSTRHSEVFGGELDVLISHARTALMNGNFESCRIELPGGEHAIADVEPVFFLGDVTGCVLTLTRESIEDVLVGGGSIRGQGAHIGRAGPRDYTTSLANIDRHRQAQDRNQVLLNPYVRAREVVATNIAEQRNHLLAGEPGTGKSTLAAEIFSAQGSSTGIETINCARFDCSAVLDRWSKCTRDQAPRRLLILRSMNSLDVNESRALDGALTALAATDDPPLVIGCVDTPAIDPSRPYALLASHFHEVVRIPALRYRVDDIGDIARSILRDISIRHSFRLGMQVVRVLEGYSWPGNISELKDVLKHVVANKPFGEIQPLDLPRLHFRDVTRKLSPLDAAQCETIIQALYEVKGNRYEAAALLGIGRSSLYRKIDAFGISYIG